jgi:hypothetical protein
MVLVGARFYFQPEKGAYTMKTKHPHDPGSLSTTETAKMIRKVLKEASPGIKFSVKSSRYAGGSSIRVAWTDGPTAAQIKSLCDRFEGSYFDGSIDYKGNRYHTLDGKPVSIYCDYIFEERSHSEAALTSAIVAAVMKFGPFNIPTVEDFKQGESCRTSPLKDVNGWAEPHWSWSNIIRRTLERSEDWCEPPAELLPSATAERIQSAGDDGYGQGTTGRIEA